MQQNYGAYSFVETNMNHGTPTQISIPKLAPNNDFRGASNFAYMPSHQMTHISSSFPPQTATAVSPTTNFTSPLCHSSSSSSSVSSFPARATSFFSGHSPVPPSQIQPACSCGRSHAIQHHMGNAVLATHPPTFTSFANPSPDFSAPTTVSVPSSTTLSQQSPFVGNDGTFGTAITNPTYRDQQLVIPRGIVQQQIVHQPQHSCGTHQISVFAAPSVTSSPDSASTVSSPPSSPWFADEPKNQAFITAPANPTCTGPCCMGHDSSVNTVTTSLNIPALKPKIQATTVNTSGLTRVPVAQVPRNEVEFTTNQPLETIFSQDVPAIGELPHGFGGAANFFSPQPRSTSASVSSATSVSSADSMMLDEAPILKAVTKRRPKCDPIDFESEAGYICDICGVVITRKSNLLRHKRIHKGVKSYPCGMCDKSFGRSDHLLTHLRMVHKQDIPKKPKKKSGASGRRAKNKRVSV